MTGRTHAITGLAMGALISPHPITIIIGCVAALLPDIDHPQAIISGWIPGGRLVGLLVGHRGPTHSLLALGALVALLMALGAPMAWTLAAAAGYASHLALDGMTARGVPALWPIGWRVRVPLLWRSGGLLEVAVTLVSLAVLGMVLLGA